MPGRSRLLAAASAAALILFGGTAATGAPRLTRHAAGRGSAHRAAAVRCGSAFDFQVRLDRERFSPGEIDGRLGDNLRRTISAFQAAHNLPQTGKPECKTWAALGGDSAPPSVTQYTVSDADVKGPFEPRIPKDIVAAAKLPALAYRTPLEEIAERFHVAPALLRKLNPRARFAAGETVQVPAVAPFDAGAVVRPSDAAPDVSIEVSKQGSALRLLGPGNELLFYAPVSSGSRHDPLPIGEWTVTLVKWHPEFRYNPALFWDADPKNTKAVVKPGPNNPVGVVWIGLNLEHYGIHGTSDPDHVGHTQSHGCVRLTNWDAARVAASVRKGTRVAFR